MIIHLESKSVRALSATMNFGFMARYSVRPCKPKILLPLLMKLALYRVVALVLVSNLSLPGFAQKTRDECIRQNTISFNLSHVQNKDENLHPNVFRGLSLGINYSNSTTKKNISEYLSGVEISFLNTRYEDFPSALNLTLRGNYKYLFPVAKGSALKYFAGPATALQYGTSLYFNWDESHFYYANYISAGVGNRIIWELSRYTLFYNLDIPIISIISRPVLIRQYKIDDMTFPALIGDLFSKPETALSDNNLCIDTGIDLRFLQKTWYCCTPHGLTLVETFLITAWKC
jgi:hypothetical protein